MEHICAFVDGSKRAQIYQIGLTSMALNLQMQGRLFVVGCHLLGLSHNFEFNVMKKMNRSQSSYRASKTLLNDEESNHSLSRNLPKQSLAPSYFEANKENNSLFQSISEREFPTKNHDQELLKQLEEKCRRQEQELTRLYGSLDNHNDLNRSSSSKTYNYSEKYYQSEMESLRALVRQKDRQLQFYRCEASVRQQQSQSVSQVSCRMDKDQRDKNLYIKEINLKAIEIKNLQDRNKLQKQEIETLRFCLQEKQKTEQQLSNKLAQAQMKRKKIQHYEAQLKQSQELLTELETTTQRLKEEAHRKDLLINDKSKAVSELQNTIASYDDKLKSIEMALIAIREEKKSLLQRNEEVARECSDWKATYEQLLQRSEEFQQTEFKLRTCQSMLDDLGRRNLQLTSQCQRYKIAAAGYDKSLGKHQEVEKQNIALKKQLQDRDERLLKLTACEKTLRTLDERLQKLKREKDDTANRLQDKTKEAKALSLSLQEERLRALRLEEELREREEESTRGRQKGQKMDLLLKENQRLNAALQERINEVEKLQIKTSTLENKLSERQSETLRLRSSLEEKQQEASEVQMEVRELRERYEAETQLRMTEQDKALKCTQEIFGLRCSLTKLDNDKQQLQDNLEQLNRTHTIESEQLRRALRESQEDRDHHEAVLNSHRAKLQALATEAEDCRRQLQEASRKEKQHRGSLGRLQCLLAQVTSERDRLVSEKDQITEKCKQLKAIHDFVMTFRQE